MPIEQFSKEIRKNNGNFNRNGARVGDLSKDIEDTSNSQYEFILDESNSKNQNVSTG